MTTETQPPHLGRRRLLVAGVGLTVLVVGGLAFTGHRTLATFGAAAGRGGTDGGAAERIVPVHAAAVQVMEFPVYLEGLGTAAAYETITVKTLIDGRLEKVNFTEGQPVKKGELLALIDARPWINQLHQSEAMLARDEANLKEAELNLARYADLAAKKLIADQQRDDQSSTVNQLKATVMLDRAQIESAQLQIDYAHITSPTDGVTGVRVVDPGNVVHAADPGGLVVVTKLDPIALLFTMSQDNLPDVAKAMAEGPLTVEAFNRDGSKKLGEGHLLLIDNQINTSTATMRLKALVPNHEHLLWPNQFVKARLQLSLRHQAKVIAAASIQNGPAGTFVYVVDANKQAQVRPVKVDLVQGDQAVIASGLTGGETVVVDGQNQLRPGAKVSLAPTAGAAPPADPDAGGPRKAANEGGMSTGAPRVAQRAGVR